MTTQALILLPRLRVQNANAISSPLTWGFPSMTAILGFTHALERALKKELRFLGVGVVCHSFDPQVADGKYEKSFILMRKPLKKDGGTAALTEEGRTHMTISLVIKAEGDALKEPDEEELASYILNMAHTLRIAGGNILPELRKTKKITPSITLWHSDTESQKETWLKIRRQLLPGFILLSREDLLLEETLRLREKNKEATSLDALLALSSITYEATKEDKGDVEWNIRKKSGWIVPITIGYQAISELYPAGKIESARDEQTPFQFVENIYSLGEWKSPHRVPFLNKILWRYESDKEKGLYRCINQPVTI